MAKYFAFKSAIQCGIVLLALATIFNPNANSRGMQQDEGEPLLPQQAQVGLLQAVDLDRPALHPVLEASGQGQVNQALRELALYYRSRPSPSWGSQDPTQFVATPQNRNYAEAAVSGKLQGGTVPLFYSFPGGRIDWHLNATDRVEGQTHNDEWQWQLNRMSFWADLARAYSASRDERYAKAFVGELRSWIRQCPPPTGVENGPGSAWRTIDTGIRISGAWIDAFYAFRKSPQMKDSDVIAMVNSLFQQATYLRQNHTQLNWLTMEMSGLYAIGAEFPEFKSASEWREFSARTLYGESENQFLPDGAQVELSTSYQEVAIDNILRIVDIARWSGHENELPPKYLARMQTAFMYEAEISAPDRSLPKINDSWPVQIGPIMRKAMQYFPQNPEFLWFASDEARGGSPERASFYFPWSGLAAMRESWKRDANYLLFRNGPLGLGHQHQDSLGAELWAYGRELVFNGGGGSYNRDKWRLYGLSSFSHNDLVVDGMDQTETMNIIDPLHDSHMKSQAPIDAHWRSNQVFDFATGIYRGGYGPNHDRVATQQRDVLFLKPDIYLIADRLIPRDDGTHTYQERWQIKTTHVRIDPTTMVVETNDTGLANLAIVPLLTNARSHLRTVSGQTNPDILGWDVRKDLNPEAVPATTVLNSMSGRGPQLLITMFVPIRANQQNPVLHVEAGSDGRSAVVELRDGRTIEVTCPSSLGITAVEKQSPTDVERSVTLEDLK